MVTNFIKIENDNQFVRDINTGAIVNVDSSGYNSYMARCRYLQTKDDKIINQEMEINNLKSEIEEIKFLLNNYFKKENS